MAVERPTPNDLITEFPIPYEGLCDEIFTEVLVDRNKFIKTSFQNMDKDGNAPLKKILIMMTMSSPYRDSALEWALMYYELNARSGRKNSSQRIVPIAEATVNKIWTLKERELAPLMEKFDSLYDTDSEEVDNIRIEMKIKIDEIDNANRERTYNDAQRGGEVTKFHINFSLLKMNQLKAGIDTDHVNGPLQFLINAISEQIESNRMSGNFKI